MKMLKFPDQLEKFGKNLQNLREALGLSQKEICDTAHLEQSYLSLIESGVKNISFNALCAIAFAMHIDPVRLFSICMSSAVNIRHGQLDETAFPKKEIHIQPTEDEFPKKEICLQSIGEGFQENETYLQLIRDEFPEMEMLLE